MEWKSAASLCICAVLSCSDDNFSPRSASLCLVSSRFPFSSDVDAAESLALAGPVLRPDLVRAARCGAAEAPAGATRGGARNELGRAGVGVRPGRALASGGGDEEGRRRSTSTSKTGEVSTRVLFLRRGASSTSSSSSSRTAVDAPRRPRRALRGPPRSRAAGSSARSLLHGVHRGLRLVLERDAARLLRLLLGAAHHRPEARHRRPRIALEHGPAGGGDGSFVGVEGVSRSLAVSETTSSPPSAETASPAGAPRRRLLGGARARAGSEAAISAASSAASAAVAMSSSQNIRRSPAAAIPRAAPPARAARSPPPTREREQRPAAVRPEARRVRRGHRRRRPDGGQRRARGSAHTSTRPCAETAAKALAAFARSRPPRLRRRPWA